MDELGLEPAGVGVGMVEASERAERAERAERLRLTALRALDVLDQPRTPQLDGLARLAAFVCGTPTAAVNLIDMDRQFSAAAYGYEPPEVSRMDSMCNISLQSRDVSYTPDAAADPRWSDNPFVNGTRERIRLYASAPLILASGEVIGSICAFSRQRQELSRVQLERLRDIADQAVLVLQLGEDAARLGHAATRDDLTGLPNRVLFSETLARAMARRQRGAASPSVIFLDIDRFKAVNDTHGHAVGDELLRAVAQRLLETVRATDLLARLSGDELVILSEVVSGDEADEAAVLVGRLRQAFVEPFELSCGELRISASVGLAIAAADETPAEVLARADAAMYECKHRRAARLG